MLDFVINAFRYLQTAPFEKLYFDEPKFRKAYVDILTEYPRYNLVAKEDLEGLESYGLVHNSMVAYNVSSVVELYSNYNACPESKQHFSDLNKPDEILKLQIASVFYANSESQNYLGYYSSRIFYDYAKGLIKDDGEPIYTLEELELYKTALANPHFKLPEDRDALECGNNLPAAKVVAIKAVISSCHILEMGRFVKHEKMNCKLEELLAPLGNPSSDEAKKGASKLLIKSEIGHLLTGACVSSFDDTLNKFVDSGMAIKGSLFSLATGSPEMAIKHRMLASKIKDVQQAKEIANTLGTYSGNIEDAQLQDETMSNSSEQAAASCSSSSFFGSSRETHNLKSYVDVIQFLLSASSPAEICDEIIQLLLYRIENVNGVISFKSVFDVLASSQRTIFINALEDRWPYILGDVDDFTEVFDVLDNAERILFINAMKNSWGDIIKNENNFNLVYSKIDETLRQNFINSTRGICNRFLDNITYGRQVLTKPCKDDEVFKQINIFKQNFAKSSDYFSSCATNMRYKGKGMHPSVLEESEPNIKDFEEKAKQIGNWEAAAKFVVESINNNNYCPKFVNLLSKTSGMSGIKLIDIDNYQKKNNIETGHDLTVAALSGP